MGLWKSKCLGGRRGGGGTEIKPGQGQMVGLVPQPEASEGGGVRAEQIEEMWKSCVTKQELLSLEFNVPSAYLWDPKVLFNSYPFCCSLIDNISPFGCLVGFSNLACLKLNSGNFFSS